MLDGKRQGALGKGNSLRYGRGTVMRQGKRCLERAKES